MTHDHSDQRVTPDPSRGARCHGAAHRCRLSGRAPERCRGRCDCAASSDRPMAPPGRSWPSERTAARPSGSSPPLYAWRFKRSRELPASRLEATAASQNLPRRRESRHRGGARAGARLRRAHGVRKHAVHHMQSPKSVAVVGGILVILVLFVVLALLAIFSKLIRARQPIEAITSRDRARGLRPRI